MSTTGPSCSRYLDRSFDATEGSDPAVSLPINFSDCGAWLGHKLRARNRSENETGDSLDPPSVEARHAKVLPEREPPPRVAHNDSRVEPQPSFIAHASIPSPPLLPATPAERGTPPSPLKPATTDESTPAVAKAAVTKKSTPGLEEIDPFFGLPQAKRDVGLENLTAEQEMELRPRVERDGLAATIQSTAHDGCAGA